MKIDNLRPGNYLPTGQEVPQTANESARGTRIPKSPSGDSIEISKNTTLARGISVPEEFAGDSLLLTPERLAEIQARVGRGYYDNSSALAQSADKLIESFKGLSK